MADTSILVIPSTMTAPLLFSPGKADQVIEEIKTVARKEAAELDISTAEGREKIASLAYKIARTKTATDKMRLELVADRKKELKLIDAEGARIWDELEGLQKEIRQPLTDWENRDKERIARHQAALAELETVGNQTANEWQSLSVDAMKNRLREIAEAYPESHDWEEFSSRGRLAVKTAKQSITDAIAKREKYDSDQAELARLRAEAAERAQKEREEAAAAKAKQEAEEKARLAAIEAERKAQAEQERIRKEAEEKQARIQREAAEREAAIERERKDAQERAERAERERLAAEERAKRQAEEAAKRAEEEKAAAVKAEQERIRREKERAEEEERLRAENRKHAAKINGEAKASLLNHTNLTAENAEEVVKAIARGLVSHVSIRY